MGQKCREGYKDTEIGNLPVDWEAKPLKDGIRLISGQHINAEDYSTDKIGVPYLTGPVDFPNGKIISTKYTNKPKSMCHKDDTLITVKGSGTGKVVLSDNEYCISRQLMAIRPINWDYKYVFYLLQMNEEKYNENAVGLIPGITRDDVLNSLVPITHISEQKKISTILSTIDEQIEQTDSLIEKTKELKKGLMQRLLTKGIGHTEFKNTEFGEIPKGWEMKKIGDICDVTKLAGFEFTKYIKYIEDGEIIALRALNLKKGRLDLTDIKRIGKKVSESLGRSKLYEGDIVFSYVGTIGEVAIIPESGKYHLAPNVAKISVTESVLPEYLVQFLVSTLAENEIKKLLTITSQPALSMGNLREIAVVVPCIKEQQKIASILSSVDVQIGKYETEKEKLQELKKSLMKQLLTGKIRVKI